MATLTLIAAVHGRAQEPPGAWQWIDDNGLPGGIEAYGVAPGDLDRLYGLNQGGGGPQVVLSLDGGQSWQPDNELDSLIQGGVAFLYQPSRGPTPYGQGPPQVEPGPA